MSKAKIAITVDEQALAEIDRLVSEGMFPNRSQAIEEAVQEIRALTMPTEIGRHLGLAPGAWSLQLLRRYPAE